MSGSPLARRASISKVGCHDVFACSSACTTLGAGSFASRKEKPASSERPSLLGEGAAVNLGPTINLDRDPRWGRSFESFSEDPFLTQALATAEIDGVQSQGELSQIKHYDDYDQETNRKTPWRTTP